MSGQDEVWEKYFKTEARLTYLVTKLAQCRQIKTGKTVIQKLMFLLGRELGEDFSYYYHYYGPYSSYIDDELKNASLLNFIKIAWFDNEGYSISPGEKASTFIDRLPQNEKTEIDKLTNKYGLLSAKNLAIIATAYYLKDKYDFAGDELISKVGKLKSCSEKDVQEILGANEVLIE